MAGPLQYQTAILETQVGSLRLRLHHIENVEAAIDAMFQELEARGCGELLEDLCPYFGSLWPSGQILAQWIWDQGEATFRGKRVIEIGCGLALPSFVAAHLGAQVVATDLHPDVPGFLARNLVNNPGFSIQFKPLDWREGGDAPVALYDWVLASDVLYEKYQAAGLVAFLVKNLTPTGQAIVLDPDRAYWERLVIQGRHAGFTVQVEHLKTGPEQKLFHLIRLSR